MRLDGLTALKAPGLTNKPSGFREIDMRCPGRALQAIGNEADARQSPLLFSEAKCGFLSEGCCGRLVPCDRATANAVSPEFAAQGR